MFFYAALLNLLPLLVFPQLPTLSSTLSTYPSHVSPLSYHFPTHNLSLRATRFSISSPRQLSRALAQNVPSSQSLNRVNPERTTNPPNPLALVNSLEREHRAISIIPSTKHPPPATNQSAQDQPSQFPRPRRLS